MKKRLISAIFLIILLVPIIIKGGFLFDVFIYLVSLMALKEFLDIKESKKTLPNFVKIMCYVILTIILFGLEKFNNIFYIDVRIVAGLFLLFLTPNILYHDKKLYSVNDAFYLIGGLLFLGVAFSNLMILRNTSLNLLIYIILITVSTDTYAFLGGYYIGRHHLIKEISPNKTWEGSLIGTAFGVFIPTVFYHSVINPELSLITLILITLFLSIISQFGDLVFSSIKRYFGKKDFSNLIPGHGGILDRLDSIIFVALGFMFVFGML